MVSSLGNVSRKRTQEHTRETDHNSQWDPDGNVADEYKPRSHQVVELLESHNGHLKQTAIVSQTEWGKSTVSRTLSEMEERGDIRKISIGRENMIVLSDAEPDWDL